MAADRKLRVFLCHASQDKSIVRELYQRLNFEGWIDPWLDEEKLLPGQEWNMEIEKAVESANSVIVFISNRSIIKEGYVQKELRKVLDVAQRKTEGEIFVIPLRLDDCQVPYVLRGWHYESYFPDELKDLAYQRIVDSLKVQASVLGVQITKLARQTKLEKLKPNEVPDLRKCGAKTKSGKPCQIPAREGQKYCHIHRRQRLWRNIISSSAFGAISLAILGFVANVAGVLSYFGIFPSVHAMPTTTLTPTLTNTVTVMATRSISTFGPTSTSFSTATPTFGLGVIQVSKEDGMLYMYVPAGEFIMGSNSGFLDEKPEHKVYLDAFWIAQTEVTNAMYSLCVNVSVCRSPSRTDYYSRDASSPVYPVVFISWNDAKTYCEWTGARLPTEAEWEKAARGVNGSIYPWGNQFECQRGNFDDETSEDADVVPGGPNCDGYKYIAPAGSFPNGKSVYGTLDMAGNIWEWVSDWYSDSYYYKYAKTPVANPTGPDMGNRRVVKGGAWLNDQDIFFRGSNRYSYPPELVDDNVGFRSVMPGQ